MLTDIEIAQSAKLRPITEIAEKIGIDEEYLIPYGKYKAKIDLEYLNTLKDKKDGKLILVTINPTAVKARQRLPSAWDKPCST